MNGRKRNKIKNNLGIFQTSDIIVKYIVEKILSNVFVTLDKKKYDSLFPIICISHLIRELNVAVQQSFMSREIDPFIIKNNPQIFFDSNYSDNNPINELEVIQPKSTVFDRWKIFQMPIIKMNSFNTKRIDETEEENKKKKKTIKYKPYTKYKIFKQMKEEENNNNKKGKNKMIDLPSYPIEDLENGGNYKNVIHKGLKTRKSTILDYQELNQYYLNKISLEEEKKQKEIEKKLKILDSIKKIKEPKKIYEKYKGKKVNIDHNGDIVLIKEIKIEDLQSDFLGPNSKLNEKNQKMVARKSIRISKINIEKMKKDGINDNSKKNMEVNKQEEKVRIIAGSSFNLFFPEIGVSIKEGIQEKNGGLDFYNKYKRFDMNKFNNTMININKELESHYKSKNFNNSMSDFKNISNKINNSSNINEDNLNNNQSLYKIAYKSISLPDIKNNMKNVKYEGNSLYYQKLRKNNSMTFLENNPPYNIDSYLIQNEIESNYVKYGKRIKAVDSFKQVMLKTDENELNDLNINKTAGHYLNKIYHKSKRNIEGYKYNRNNKYNEINNFNRTILNDNNWGKISLEDNSTFNISQYWKRKKFNYIKKKVFNPYSTLRSREKKIENNSDKLFNQSKNRNNNEQDFIKKYKNRSYDK